MSNQTISEEVRETSPLTDIEDIHAARPDLEPEQWKAVEQAIPWLKATLRPEARKELDVEYAKKYAEEIDKLRAESKALVNQQMEEWRASQKPLDMDEMKTLLSQEYVTVPVRIKTRKNKQFVVREFTLCELPQSVEKKFAAALQNKLVSFIENAAAVEWSMNVSTAQQLQMILDNIPAAFDTAAELVAIALDPWGEEEDIDATWVQDNMSSFRIANAIITQIEVNKYRDFFSSGSRLFRTKKSR